jgi:hypothetical protein
MATEAQIVANQQNARKSTGPRMGDYAKQTQFGGRDCLVAARLAMTGIDTAPTIPPPSRPGAKEAIVQNKANLQRTERTLIAAREGGYEGKVSIVPLRKQSQFSCGLVVCP